MTSEVTDQAEGTVHHGYASVLRNPQFMSLWIAQVFSQFADRAVFVLFVALLTTVQHSTIAGHYVGAAQITSFLYVAFTIPAIILSPIAGVYVDRWSNKAVLVGSNIARGFFVALITWSLIQRSPVAALTLAFLLSIGSQFFAPAEAAAIPRLVKKEDLYSANSLFFTTMMIALGFGFAIGDPIIQSSGIGKAPYAVAIGFLIAAILLMFVPDSKPKPVKEEQEPWWEELRFGLAYIATSRTVFRAIFKITILFSTIITLNIIAVGLSEQVLDLKPQQFGYVVAAAGFGMGLGNFFVAQYGQKWKPTILAYKGFISLGFFMSVLGSLGFIKTLGPQYLGLPNFSFQGVMLAVPLIIAALVGSSCAMVAVPTYAALQAAVPEELRGKVFGAQNTAMSFASTIPVILVGVAADNLPGGVSTTLFVIGLPTVLAGFHFLFEELKFEKQILREEASAEVKAVS
ncbi:MAG: MFS transporter [Candidatus Obscuribacterales bacterium]|nr:MFS transporter [Candidatus Obscuribacterales bacterium]